MRGVFKNTGLKAMALVFAAALWFFVAGQNPVEVGFVVPVGFNGVPGDMVVTRTDPGEVEVRVKGPKFIMNNLTPAQIIAGVNLEGAPEGLTAKRLLPQDVVTPTGVQVVSLNPDSISVWMEGLSEEVLPVKVRLRGRPSAGFRIAGIRVSPRTVSVTGVRSEVEGLGGIYSEPVDVEGLRASRAFTSRLEVGTGLRSVSADKINVQVIVRRD